VLPTTEYCDNKASQYQSFPDVFAQKAKLEFELIEKHIGKQSKWDFSDSKLKDAFDVMKGELVCFCYSAE